ncbi:hypothetical protein F5883DRAFT_512484 [Diaporthe sp. PMI_573]|nr:hypothetical protein F5883DRAFT_512484 [Diaporthaceae sp. PMI_573]
MLHSIDQFIRVVFEDSIQRFTYRDLLIPKVKENSSLQWQRVADLYCMAEGYLRAGCKRKFVISRNKAHLELRFLAPLSMEGQRMRHHVFIVRFWRICYKLLKLDLAWPEYEYSFVTDFLLELQRLVRDTYGEHHPLRGVLVALCQVSKADMREMLSKGASRTVQVMAPAVKAKQAMVLKFWTDFSFLQQG